MTAFSKIIIAILFPISIVFIASVLWAKSIELFFITGLSLFGLSVILIFCMIENHLRLYSRRKCKNNEQTGDN